MTASVGLTRAGGAGQPNCSSRPLVSRGREGSTVGSDGYGASAVMLLVGLAAVVILAVVVAMALAFRRHRQTAELQEHFHAAYDEGARWKPLDDSEGPISSNE